MFRNGALVDVSGKKQKQAEVNTAIDDYFGKKAEGGENIVIVGPRGRVIALTPELAAELVKKRRFLKQPEAVEKHEEPHSEVKKVDVEQLD